MKKLIILLALLPLLAFSAVKFEIKWTLYINGHKSAESMEYVGSIFKVPINKIDKHTTFHLKFTKDYTPADSTFITIEHFAKDGKLLGKAPLLTQDSIFELPVVKLSKQGQKDIKVTYTKGDFKEQLLVIEFVK